MNTFTLNLDRNDETEPEADLEEDIKDIRVYIYESGSLRKSYHFKKTYKNIDLLNKDIELNKKNAFKHIHKNAQLVVVEYYGLYNSKIIQLIDIE